MTWPHRLHKHMASHLLYVASHSVWLYRVTDLKVLHA